MLRWWAARRLDQLGGIDGAADFRLSPEAAARIADFMATHPWTPLRRY